MRLEVDRVTAAYGSTTVLRHASLVVPTGGVVALLGPNGAGKTTMLSTISGLLVPRSGRILLGGVDVTARAPQARVRLGLGHVTEGRSIFPGLTVRDNLRMFAPRGQQDDAMDQAIGAFPRLGERLQQTAGTMSGGEQQMLALSRAYVSEAQVVLLDEVSLGLAPIIVDAIFEFLGRLKDEGRSLLIVEQYVSKALALADTVYLLARGRMVFAGEPAEVSGSELFARYMGETAGI
jgi:branched-chain amino acid transport system ATP-binding protein